MDRMTRKVMTMRYVDMVYMTRFYGGMGLINVEICARTDKNNLAGYVKRLTESLVKRVKIANIVDCEALIFLWRKSKL